MVLEGGGGRGNAWEGRVPKGRAWCFGKPTWAELAGEGGPYAIVYRGVDQPCQSAAFQEGGACAYRIEDWLRHPGRVGVGSVEGGGWDV